MKKMMTEFWTHHHLSLLWVTASSNHPRVPKVVGRKTNFWNPWMVRGILSTARVG